MRRLTTFGAKTALVLSALTFGCVPTTQQTTRGTTPRAQADAIKKHMLKELGAEYEGIIPNTGCATACKIGDTNPEGIRSVVRSKAMIEAEKLTSGANMFTAKIEDERCDTLSSAKFAKPKTICCAKACSDK